MSNQSLGNRVQADLEQAVQSGLLPDSIQPKAEQLLSRLQKPVRVALLGMPGAGKSSILNLLVGERVMPDGVRLPTLQLNYGDAEKAVCTLPDGSKSALDRVDMAEIAALSPVFVEIWMPLPALRKISLLEVVAPDDPNAIHRASQWAAKRSDVTLWATRGYNETEQRIWGTMPDLTKDHAFCMITGADFLKTEGMLETTIGAVKRVAKNEFAEVLAIATTQAINARHTDGSVDKDAMRDSGGSALISAVLKQVEMGRQSAVDMADVLLHQNADALASIPAQSADPADLEDSQPTDKAEPAETEPNQTTEAKPQAQDAISRLREIAARKNLSRDAAADIAAREAEEAKQAAALKPATRDAFTQVVTYIEDRGAELAAVLEEEGDGGPSEVMELATDHVQWLCDYLNEHGDDADQSLQRMRSAAFDAADMVQLMQMEKRDDVALDAVSLMLQIKRELQADLAA